jgi:general secretion pathway protein J
MHLIRSGSGAPRPTNSLARQTNRRSGFSMLEALAALIMTTFLFLALTPFVSQMLATWARGGEAANLVELKSRGLGQLRDDLRHAIVWTDFGKIQDLAAFRGDETSMYFPVVAGLGPNANGVEYLSFTVNNTIGGSALVRRRAAVIGSTYGTFVDPVVLVSGHFKYTFKYFSRGGEESPVWTVDRFDLPGRVELQIVDRDRLLFSVPIMISTFGSLSAACFVSNLQGCQTLADAIGIDLVMKAHGLAAPSQ